MALTMYRNRTQALFGYLPYQTYNWQQRLGSFIGTNDVDSREIDVPRSWVKRNLVRLIRPFVEEARRQGVDLPAITLIERDDFVLLEPQKFRGELFPKVFLCLQCGRFVRSDEPPDRLTCQTCQRKMEQWPFVEFHKCGYIGGLVPPTCKNNCGAPMRLMNRESRSFKEWEWKCSRCGTKANRGVYHPCPTCRGREMVKVLRADAGPVFHSQYVQVVNPPSQAEFALLDTDRVYAAAVAQSLGALPPGLDGLRNAINESGTDASLDAARRQLIEEYGFERDDPMLETMLQRRRARAEGRVDWVAIVDRLGLTEEEVVDLGFQCVELALARAASPVTLADLIDSAPSSALRALYDRDYRAMLAKYGFAEASLLREFPLAYVVAGYTRDGREPESGAALNFFRGPNGKLAMYGQRTETEALLFRLSPAKVLAWLVRSGVVDDPGDVDPQAWLFSVMRPIPSIFEPPNDRVTAAVLGLVHSVAHRVLQAVAVRSGLSEESLSEYLFPHNLAFLIYADTRSEFVLGGLEHVYRNYLAASLQGMDAETRCVFDPPCDNDVGACAVCLYLSENSCARFNTSLSRWYLFGGGPEGSTSTRWQGYWNR